MDAVLSIFRYELKILVSNRGSMLMGAVHQIILTGGQIMLWISLMNQGSMTNAAPAILETTMIQYVLMTTLIWSFAEFRVVDTINDRISQGHAVVDLLRPVGFPKLVVINETARFVFSAIVHAFPTVLIFGVIFGLNVPSLVTVVLTLFFVMGGWILAMQMGWCVGIAAFWVFDTTQAKFALQGITALFSGALVPLWFFPEPLRDIATMLPFQLLFHAPLTIWLDLASDADIFGYASQLVVWIGVFWLLSGICWRQSLKHFVAQGG